MPRGNAKGTSGALFLHSVYKERALKCVGSTEIVHNGMCSYDTPGEEQRGICGFRNAGVGQGLV